MPVVLASGRDPVLFLLVTAINGIAPAIAVVQKISRKVPARVR